MLRKTALLLLIAFILIGGQAFGQFDRDEVLNITFPVAGTVVDTDSVVVTFDLAPYFDIGDSGCVDCDGYLVAYLNGMEATTAHDTGSFTIYDLVDGYYALMVEAVDPSGASFNPVVFDTASFQVAYEENFCPPTDLAVSSDYEYEVLSLFWVPPMGSGGTSMNAWDFENDDGGFEPTADWDPVGDWEWTDNYDFSLYSGAYYAPPAANSGTGLWTTVPHGDHTGSGGRSFLRKTVNLAGYSTVEISFWSWLDVWGAWDYCELYANGTLVWEYSLSTVPTAWVENIVDLSAFAGDPEVELSFEYYATTVVNHAGWYLDDVSIGVPAVTRVSERTGREIVPTCGDLTGYNIYKDNVFLATVDTNLYRDEAVVVGTEYCYSIEAVYDDDGTEVYSTHTDTVCAIPEVYTPAPVTNLSSYPLDEEIYLSWTPPGTPSYIFYEEFSNGIPASWTVIDGGEGPATWASPHDNSNAPFSGFGDNLYAICDSDDAPSDELLDEQLITPIISLTNYNTPYLQFTTFYNDINAADSLEAAEIDVSLDGGATWTNIVSWSEDHGTAAAPEVFAVDLSAIAGGQESVQIRFHYMDNDRWAWSWAIDDIAILDGAPLARRDEGDFTQYFVYQDGSLIDSTENTNYLAGDLTNGVTYAMGVSAGYYPDYVSAPVTLDETPVWLYGDVAGVITDPAGNLLDSAVVKSGTLTDTTGVDGAYFLKNLDPGVHTVSVSRPGFDGSAEEVTITAVEDAAVLDFMMIPKLGVPVGLMAYGGDLEVDLAWNSPGSVGTGEWMFFHDGIFENAFAATSGGMGLAQLFVPASYPATIQAVRFHTSDFGSPTQEAEVWVFADDGFTVLSGPYNLPGVSNDWIEIDIDDATIESGGFLVATYNVLAGGPYVSVDDSYYDGTLFFGNAADGWDELGTFGYFYVGSHEALIASAGARSITETGDVANSAKTILRNEQLEGQWTAAGFHGESAERLPNVLRTTTNTRTDSLIAYHIYQELTTGDSLVGVNAGDDTTATIDVPVNYVNYCFTVKAVWDTDVYDTLESKPSNIACVETYLPGDVDFVDGVTLIDLLMVVDFALDVVAPTPEQVRGADINRDGMINIQDIIMIVDIILPPTVTRSSASGDAAAAMELAFDGHNNLKALLNYNGSVRGAQFTVKYDAEYLELGQPGSSGSDVLVSANSAAPGEMTIVVANVAGGSLSIFDETLVSVPVTVKGKASTINIILEGTVLIGENGIIPVAEKSISVDVLSVPVSYSLHQNYPNPFNPDTDIMFDIPDAGAVELTIYNLMGQKVRTLVKSEMPAGYHTVRWNGLTDNGSPVSTGMYFYQISAGSFSATKKMLMLK